MPPISGLKFEWEGDTSPNTKTKSDEIQMWAMGLQEAGEAQHGRFLRPKSSSSCNCVILY